MGVESYFVHANMVDENNLEAIIEIIQSNSSMNIINIYEKSLIKKRIRKCKECYAINSIVKIAMLDMYTLSFEACFSCFEKSLDIIADVLQLLKSLHLCYVFSYCTNNFDFTNFDKLQVKDIIRSLTNERHLYFVNNYTAQTFNVLPEKFFSYYNKHRQKLK